MQHQQRVLHNAQWKYKLADRIDYLCALVCFCRCLSKAFSIAGLCFLSKLMAWAMMSSRFTLEKKTAFYWFQLGTFQVDFLVKMFQNFSGYWSWPSLSFRWHWSKIYSNLSMAILICGLNLHFCNFCNVCTANILFLSCSVSSQISHSAFPTFLGKRDITVDQSNLSPMKMSVVIHLKHIHLFAHNKQNLWLPSCLLVATDSAHWVTTFHLSKLSPRFYNIRAFCVRASGVGPARAPPLSPSKAIKPMSTDPAIYCDSVSLLISFIKHSDWRRAKKVCSVIMASHKFTHTHTGTQLASHVSWLRCSTWLVSCSVYHSHSRVWLPYDGALTSHWDFNQRVNHRWVPERRRKAMTMLNTKYETWSRCGSC